MRIASIAMILFRIAAFGETSKADADGLLRFAPEHTSRFVYVRGFDTLINNSSRPDAKTTEQADANLDRALRGFHSRFGVTPALLVALQGGDVLHAEVSPPGKSRQGLLLATAATATTAHNVLAKCQTELLKERAVAKKFRMGDVDVVRYAIPISASKSRTVIQAYVAGLLLCATDMAIAQNAIAELGEPGISHKGKPPGLDVVVQQTIKAQRSGDACVVWYCDPWSTARSSAAPNSVEFDQAKRHGVTGIQCVGGAIAVGPDDILVAQSVVVCPKPLRGSLRMLQLEPTAQWMMPGWMSSHYDEFVMLNGDVPEALKHIGVVFDDMFAEGIEGTFEAILEDLKDPDGLGIDLEPELFKFLGPKVALLRHRSSDGRHNNLLTWAFEVSQSASAARAVRMLFEDDPEVESVAVDGCDHPLWVIPGENGGPQGAIAVARGYLLYTEDAAMLRRALRGPDGIDQQLDGDIRKMQNAVRIVCGQHPCAVWVSAKDDKDAGASVDETEIDMHRRLARFFAEGPTVDFGQLSNDGAGSFQSLLAELAPLRGEFRLAVGVLHEQGWSLFSK